VLILASLLVFLAAVGAYAVACAVAPFRPSGRLRYGRRALNAWRRAHDAGTR
jgi:hypothetical protein